jgi:hypothetical protein
MTSVYDMQSALMDSLTSERNSHISQTELWRQRREFLREQDELFRQAQENRLPRREQTGVLDDDDADEYYEQTGVLDDEDEYDEPIPPQGAEFDEFDDEFAPPQYGGPGDGDSAPPQDAGLTREYEFDLNDDELDLQRDMYFQLQQGHQARQERQQVHQREEIRENVLRAALERQRRAQRFTLRRRAHW